MKTLCASIVIGAALGCGGDKAPGAAPSATQALAAPIAVAPPSATASASPPPKLVAGPDGKHAVVMREHGRETVRLDSGTDVEIADDRVVLVDVDTLEERELAKNDMKEGCSTLTHPRQVDEKTVVVQSYGLGAPTIHNLAVCAIDVPTGKIHRLASRTRCALFITVGRYRGDFFVKGMRFTVGAGPSADPSIVTPTGKLVHRFPTYPFANTKEQSPECSDAAPAADVLRVLEKL